MLRQSDIKQNLILLEKVKLVREKLSVSHFKMPENWEICQCPNHWKYSTKSETFLEINYVGLDSLK